MLTSRDIEMAAAAVSALKDSDPRIHAVRVVRTHLSQPALPRHRREITPPLFV